MDKKSRRRWLMGLAVLMSLGGTLVNAASRFDGFRRMCTVPLLLGAVCLVSGMTLVLLWAGEFE